MCEHYSKEFQEKLAKMVDEDGRDVSDLAEEFNIKTSTIHDWVFAYKMSKTKVERDLKKEIEELKERNEILEKAVKFFKENLK